MNKENVLTLAENKIKPLENLKLGAYRDGAGNPSIGYGATTIDFRKVTMLDTCTEAQATQWLQEKISEDYNQLESFCRLHELSLEDHQAAAILSFTYNAGFKAFQNSSMAKDLILKRMDKLTSDLLKWDKIRVDGKLVFSAGLFNRRMQESLCFIDEARC
jgi:lysozyme